MTCDEMAILLHALIDGELDAGHAREVEAHIVTCAGCTARLAAYRDLRAAMRPAALAFPVPPALRGKIDRAVPRARAASRRSLLRGLLWGGAASAVAAASVALIVVRHEQDDRIVSEAISAHLRSLQADHLTDVPSSNQHTVKPWFNGRIDLSPPVVDLSAQGFTLVGGRLDFIEGKPVAVVVYRRREHVINVFVGQDLGAAPAVPTFETVQGYNVLRWGDQGLSLMAVSDLNRKELLEFGAKFRAGTRPPAT